MLATDVVVVIAVSVLDRAFSVMCPQDLNKTRVWEPAAPGRVLKKIHNLIPGKWGKALTVLDPADVY